MEYISTKELSGLWNMSCSRILRLAKENRIPGAKLIGKSWMFPVHSVKPSDKRRKETVENTAKPAFRFPLYFYCSYSKKEIESEFSKEEQSLYQGQQLFHCGHYSEASVIFQSLLETTKDKSVRYGALYCHCITNIHLHNYARACQLYHEINLMFLEDIDFQKEVEFMLHDLETYFSGNQYYLDNFHIDSEYNYPSNMYGYLMVESAYSDMLRTIMMQIPVNSVPYELACKYENSECSPLLRILNSAYTAIMLSDQGLKEKGRYYLYTSCKIAGENHMENMLSYIAYYLPEFFESTLQDNDPQLLQRIKQYAEEMSEAFHGLLEYQGKTEYFQLLDSMDYRFILFAKNGLSHQEIASILHLSTSSISKKYAALYEKTGTHSKSELADLFHRYFTSY